MSRKMWELWGYWWIQKVYFRSLTKWFYVDTLLYDHITTKTIKNFYYSFLFWIKKVYFRSLFLILCWYTPVWSYFYGGMIRRYYQNLIISFTLFNIHKLLLFFFILDKKRYISDPQQNDAMLIHSCTMIFLLRYL